MIFRTQISTHSARSSAAFDPTSVADFDGSGNVEEDNVSSRSSVCSTGSSEDEFARLKDERNKERRNRAMQKLVRSVSGNRQSATRSSTELDTETLLLTELAEASRVSILRSERDSRSNETDNV